MCTMFLSVNALVFVMFAAHLPTSKGWKTELWLSVPDVEPPARSNELMNIPACCAKVGALINHTGTDRQI